MDPKTGRIEVVATEEDRLDAQRRGLIELSDAGTKKVFPMTHEQRIEWAQEREELQTLHHSMHSGKTRNQRKAERRNRGKNRSK